MIKVYACYQVSDLPVGGRQCLAVCLKPDSVSRSCHPLSCSRTTGPTEGLGHSQTHLQLYITQRIKRIYMHIHAWTVRLGRESCRSKTARATMSTAIHHKENKHPCVYC